jgi:hypothetical protein
VKPPIDRSPCGVNSTGPEKFAVPLTSRYTCKDLAESLAGKDRYEFEKFFAPRTVLTLSESVFRFIDTRQMAPV